MAAAKTTIKGSTDIRTWTGKSASSRELKYKMHMRLCCLEMEKHRREQERKAAMDRVNRCDSRVAQIDAEVESLLALIAGFVPGPKTITGSSSSIKTAARTSTPLMHKY